MDPYNAFSGGRGGAVSICQIPSVPPKVHAQSAGRKQHQASGTADLNLWVVTPTGGVAYQIP